MPRTAPPMLRIQIRQSEKDAPPSILKLPPTPRENAWLDAYWKTQHKMIDGQDLQIFPVILGMSHLERRATEKRVLCSSDEQPYLFSEIGVHHKSEESFIVLCPSPSLTEEPTSEEVTGALAIDIAEALLDLPTCRSYARKADAVLAFRAAMATLVVAHAHERRYLSSPESHRLLGQVRRDFIVSLEATYPNLEGFNKIRLSVEGSPGLITAVRDITQEAMERSASTDRLSIQWLRDQADSLVSKYAPNAP